MKSSVSSSKKKDNGKVKAKAKAKVKAGRKVKAKKKLITRIAFAKMLGVTPETIYKHVKDGNLTLIDGKIDPPRAKKELMKNIDMTHASSRIKLDDEDMPSKSDEKLSDSSTFNKAKAYKERYKAKMAELEYKIKISEYVRSVDVENAAFSFARKIRDKMLNVPDRVQSDIAAITGLKAAEVRKIILKEVEICLKGV